MNDDDQAPEELEPTTGSTPTDAYLAMNALLVRVLIEVARRRQDELPGLLESCQDLTVLTVGPTTRSVHGWFLDGVWRFGDHHVHELFLNGDWQTGCDASVSAAEQIMTTLCHEACHCYAHVNRIQDTSRQGRYHNRRFAEIALQIGLEVKKHPSIGHHTPRLSAWARVEYADLLAELDEGLVLAREPQPRKRGQDKDNENAQAGGEPNSGEVSKTSSKYVFASCRCQIGRSLRTIRVAMGSWQRDVFQCNACDSPFEES